MNKKIILLSIYTSFLLANTERFDLSERQMNSVGKRTYEGNQVIDYNKIQNDLGRFNYAEAIYEHYKAYQYRIDKKTTAPAQMVSAGYNFFEEKTRQEEARLQELANLEKQFNDMQKEPQISFLQGYCTTPNELTVERVAGYTLLRCDFLEHGQGTLAISVTPDFYSQALIGTPLYVTLNNNQKYTVQNGVVLNGTRTSINIASSVNDRLIQKVIASVGITSSSIATKYAQAYLDERKASREVEQEGDVITNGDTVIQKGNTTNHQNPPKSDYITGAVVELVSSLASIVGNAYIDSIPYTFKINSNTILYTDLKIDFNEKGMRGINYTPSNMIQIDEPRFNQENNMYIDREKAKEIQLDGYNSTNKYDANPIPLNDGLNNRGKIK